MLSCDFPVASEARRFWNNARAEELHAGRIGQDDGIFWNGVHGKYRQTDGRRLSKNGKDGEGSIKKRPDSATTASRQGGEAIFATPVLENLEDAETNETAVQYIINNTKSIVRKRQTPFK